MNLMSLFHQVVVLISIPPEVKISLWQSSVLVKRRFILHLHLLKVAFAQQQQQLPLPPLPRTPLTIMISDLGTGPVILRGVGLVD